MAMLALVLILSLAVSARAQEQEEPPYRPGGPLAGLQLPLFPTQHGEPAGFPGAIPELRVTQDDGYITHSPDGMAPQEYLYPGSVEHWHAYFYKYLPIQSMFTQQSLLKNWVARRGGDARYGFDELPGLQADQIEEYAEPIVWVPRHRSPQHTGRFAEPVPVVRATVEGPEFSLNLGTLDPGLYSVRVIGAVETEKIQRHRLPLYMRMTVNDGIEGEENTYRIRGAYVDEFYSVAEFYFHAPARRDYQAVVAVEDGTQVDLLVHNIDLHDCLAGHEHRAIKQSRTLTAEVAMPVNPADNTEERLHRDSELWSAFPPINFHRGYTYGMNSNDGRGNWPRVGFNGKTLDEVGQEFGDWNTRIRGLGDVIMRNDQLGLEYTLTDFRAGRPLPDPYPIKDRGMGYWTAPEEEGVEPMNSWIVPNALEQRMRAYKSEMSNRLESYRRTGDADAGRDAALMLIRMAYQLPTVTAQNTMHAVVIQPGSWGRDHGCRRRDPHTGFLAGVEINNDYDMLFDLISSDVGLARSVGRFIPSVETPEDLVALMDSYLVQTTAKRCLRYHTYSSNVPARILTPAICLGDNELTKPWLEWLFSSTFIYPLPPSGLQDLMISGNDRNGMGYIASHYYAHGEQAAPLAIQIEEYIKHGGDKQYDLSDPALYPKPLEACYWYFKSRTAGNYFPRIGDVCGPDKGYGHPLFGGSMERQSAIGWRWSKDPQFAWFLANGQRDNSWSDEEWQEIVDAAATIDRAPYWENSSRVLINWGGFLESGIQHSDPRLRSSAIVRIGQGWGHHHDDTLDLQIHALGLPMTIDGGQRPGYTNPGDRKTRTHNLVEVDGRDWLGHAWINSLSDVEGARYLSAQAEPPQNHPDVRLYKRQVSLVDVNEGDLNAEAGDMLNSYVFDVVRVAGGNTHTHCFHAMLEDEIDSNVDQRISLDRLEGDDAAYAGRFRRDVEGLPQSSAGFAGIAPEVLETTWRWQREQQGNGLSEQRMNGSIFDADAPRKYTKLHLLGQQGMRVMTGWSHCHQWNYGWTNQFTQRKGEDLESVFPAIIEPFAGEPFITGRRLVTIADNENDALRAVAVEVQLANGRTDLVFTDGRPERLRTVENARISGEYGFISRDADGVRLVTVTGGSLVDSGDGVALEVSDHEYSGRIVDVDYSARQMTIDGFLPADLLAGGVIEVGVPGHMITYTIKSAEIVEGGTRLTMTEGSDFYLSRVLEVDEENNIVYSTLAFTHNEKKPNPGVDTDWVASNEEQTKFWRADYLGDIDGTNRYAFQFDGPVSIADFGALKGIRLWEYGVGDSVRMSSHASARRVEDGWEVSANSPCTLRIGGNAAEITAEDLAAGGGSITVQAQ